MIIKHNRKLGDISESLTLTVLAEGFALCDSAWRATEISPAYTRLYYTLSGSGKIKTEFEEITLSAGTLYIIPLDNTFSYSCDGEMQQLYFHINLKDIYGNDILRGINTVLSRRFTQDHINLLLNLYNGSNAPTDRLFLKSLLQTDILSLLFASNTEIKKHSPSDVVKKAILFIEDNLSATLTLKEIADGIFVSSHTLSHKFKNELGISPGQYIDGLIMSRAENLLTDTDLPISQISEMLGFYDRFYFSRRFKEKHSVTPLKYRKLRHFDG